MSDSEHKRKEYILSDFGLQCLEELVRKELELEDNSERYEILAPLIVGSGAALRVARNRPHVNERDKVLCHLMEFILMDTSVRFETRGDREFIIISGEYPVGKLLEHLSELRHQDQP